MVSHWCISLIRPWDFMHGLSEGDRQAQITGNDANNSRKKKKQVQKVRYGSVSESATKSREKQSS